MSVFISHRIPVFVFHDLIIAAADCSDQLIAAADREVFISVYVKGLRIALVVRPCQSYLRVCSFFEVLLDRFRKLRRTADIINDICNYREGTAFILDIVLEQFPRKIIAVALSTPRHVLECSRAIGTRKGCFGITPDLTELKCTSGFKSMEE